ncbi:MAG: signal peptide peptidase SppA [Bacteroidales bacterium]|nr:signal peptide peptidase SppA [Bacteroidales bacterium]
MLKRFFISMLGTVAGIWVAITLAVVGGIMVAGVAIGSAGDSAVKVERGSILYFDLSGNIAERAQKQNFFALIQNIDNDTPTLDDMIRALDLAADDKDIEALYLYCGGSGMGTASREELLQSIVEFRQASGKPVIAYADSYTQGDYLLASAADSIFLNPMGAVDIHGVGAMVPFYKGLLDKAGVKMQIVKVGTFKSAVEPYILNSMSEPARLQMQQYVDSIWGFTYGAIAANRHIQADSIRIWASDVMATWQAPEFVNDGLADNLLYERQVENYLKDITDIDSDEELRFITPRDYLSARPRSESSPERNHIAVYYCVGDIVDAGEEGISGAVVPGDIVKLADNKKVQGLVLRVNSGGGSAFASEQIWEALQYFKSKGKPFYVSMGDYAASGGYYISCGADTIFADATTLTGSIGVFGMIPDFSGLVTDKLGVTFSTVQSNPNAVGLSAVAPMTPSMAAAMQRSVENTYDLFTRRVAEGRGMTQDEVKAIAEGRVWVGSKAVELGLVDHLGSLQEAIYAMAYDLDMDPDHAVRYPRVDEKIWERIIREAGGMDAVKAYAGLDEETLRMLSIVKSLREMNPVQARMETVTVE